MNKEQLKELKKSIEYGLSDGCHTYIQEIIADNAYTKLRNVLGTDDGIIADLNKYLGICNDRIESIGTIKIPLYSRYKIRQALCNEVDENGCSSLPCAECIYYESNQEVFNSIMRVLVDGDKKLNIKVINYNR